MVPSRGPLLPVHLYSTAKCSGGWFFLAHKCSVTGNDTCYSPPPPRINSWHSRPFLTGVNLDFPVSVPIPSLKQTVLITFNYIHGRFCNHRNIYFKNSDGDLVGINNVSCSLSQQKPCCPNIKISTEKSEVFRITQSNTRNVKIKNVISCHLDATDITV